MSATDHRYWILCVIAGLSVVGLALLEPIAQDASYHAFADQRTVLGIPNFWNVVSNVSFLVVGISGLQALRKNAPSYEAFRVLSPAYAVLFVAAIFICFGSAYYHLHPDNRTLTWDRLPMTVAFTAFVAIIIGEHMGPALGRRWLPFLVLFGISSVAYWWLTELRGHGDLRPYVLVQFLPMALLPAILVLFPSAFSKVYLFWGVLGVYAAAKALEVLDERVYLAVGLSGHTLKHVTAAGGVYLLVLAVRQRR